nr:olfactory receptor 66 [Gregopimpla kuwanae]
MLRLPAMLLPSKSNFMPPNDSLNRKLHLRCDTSSIPEGLPVYLLNMPSKTSSSEVTWNADIVHAFGLYKMVNQIIGIWPLNCHDLFSKARVLVITILQISMTANLFRELKSDCVTAEEVVTFLGLMGVSVIALVKIMVLRLNQQRMNLLIRTAVEDWSKVEDTEERSIMREHASTGRFVFIFQMSSAYATIVSMILGSLPFFNQEIMEGAMENNVYNYSNFSVSSPPPFLLTTSPRNSQRTLPMGTACFVADMPTVLYGLIYIVQVIQLMTTAAGNIGTDVYFFGVALHVCGQFELLKTSFKKFGQEPDIHKCRMELKQLVRRHNQLIILSNNFEETFNLLILAQLCLNSFYMSLLGILLSLINRC